jgi:ribonuclease E
MSELTAGSAPGEVPAENRAPATGAPSIPCPPGSSIGSPATTDAPTAPPADAAEPRSPRRRRRRGGRGRGRRGGAGRAAGTGRAGGTGAPDGVGTLEAPGAADEGGDLLPGRALTDATGDPGGDLHVAAGDLDDDLDPRARGPRGEDYTDAAADRGYTSDDVAALAKSDAGLDLGEADLPPGDDVAEATAAGPGGAPAVAAPRIGDTRPAPPARPKIGDTRPAPAVPAEAQGEAVAKKRRRRRRGGRNRGGGRAGPSFVDGTLDVGDVDVDGTAILDRLDEKTLERRLGSTRKGRPAGRYLAVVHVHEDGVAQMSVLEGRQLVEHYVSRPTDDDTSIDGNIYLGRVQNVLPGMEAAFVDIGTPKNAVLYRSDVAFSPDEVEGDTRPKIERMLKNGQSILVQVTKNPIGHKGARLTQEVSLAGRFVVMVPGQPKTYGISKRLPDDERRRLRRVLDKVRPKDHGLIVRTAAEGATEDELRLDLERLSGQWAQIEALAQRSRPGSLLYREPPLVVRVIREEFTKEYRAIVIDDARLFEEVRGYLLAVAPELADRVELYDAAAEGLPIFEKFHIHEQLHKAMDRKVWLPSGGSLVIEHTEALTVIDVNTAKNVGRSSLEETVFANNVEAADVIARELRLRDIGGIIVIDFIDMEDESNRREVERAFKEALARDKTRTQVYPISELGLLQMTRKRIGEGMVDMLSQTCPHCAGRGYLVDAHLFD